MRDCWYFTALASCTDCDNPTNKLTANNDQFLGIMTSEYLDQMKPVAAKLADCDTDNLSGGLDTKSLSPAKTRP